MEQFDIAVNALRKHLGERGWAVGVKRDGCSELLRVVASKRGYTHMSPLIDTMRTSVMVEQMKEFVRQCLEKDREADEAKDGLFPKPRVMIVGHGRHGKDEAAFALHNFGPFVCAGSTSWQALPFIAKELKLPQQRAWEERHQNREFWKSFCDRLRKDDPARLIKLALKHGNVIAGVRDRVEIEAAVDQKLFDAVLWVDRPGFPVDTTVTFSRMQASDILLNDGTLPQLHSAAQKWATTRFSNHFPNE